MLAIHVPVLDVCIQSFKKQSAVLKILKNAFKTENGGKQPSFSLSTQCSFYPFF